MGQPMYQNNINTYCPKQPPPQQPYLQHPPYHQYPPYHHQQTFPQNDKNSGGYPNIYNRSQSMNSAKVQKNINNNQSHGLYPNIYKNSTSQSPEELPKKIDHIHIDDNNNDDSE